MNVKVRCSLGLLLVLMLSLLPVSAPAQVQLPSTLQWAPVGEPGRVGNIVVSPSEVSEIAIGGDNTFYAIDSPNSKVYKSVNAGAAWIDITSHLVAAGATLPATKVAMATDKSDTVAVVTNTGTKVYLSINGGATWIDTNVPSLIGTTIQCIAISKYDAGLKVREIAIGTAAWGDNFTTGQVWVLQLGEFVGAWQNQNITVDPLKVGAEVSAIAYSPKYRWDQTILVIASTAGDIDMAPVYQNRTWLCIGRRNISAGTTLWNAASPWFPGYPVEIAELPASPSAGDGLGVTRVASSIALPSDYFGGDPGDPESRRVFVSYDRQPDANDDVYRLDDTTCTRLKANGGAAIDIRSIAYYGIVTSGPGISNKLLAGDVNPIGPFTVLVRRTMNPLAAAPAWQLSSQPPSGPGNARVAWNAAGTEAYCGTSSGGLLDESAFSRSFDNGDTWEQISLIDTSITLLDIAVAPDSKTLFLATYSAFGPESVWRSAGEPLGTYWARLLTMNTTSNRIILRLSPDYSKDYTIYVAEIGGSNLAAVSHYRGNYWRGRRAPGPVIDMVVEDKDTVYIALPGGQICKSTNTGWSWNSPVPTGLPDINMLSLAKKGHILAGSRNGKVAYTTDGGITFTEIRQAIGSGTGDVQVIADAQYPENSLIYAGTNIADEGVWRWSVGLAAAWEQIDKSITDLGLGQCISGLAIGSEGTLYALRLEPVNAAGAGGMTRSLNPSEALPTVVNFDVINRSLPLGATFNPSVVFPNTMPYLKLSGDSPQNDLWAIDATNEIIYRFSDTLCKTGPALSSPREVDSDPVTGRNQGVSLAWQPISLDDQYEIQIAIDDRFTARITVAEPVTNPLYTPPEATMPTYYIPPGQLPKTGATYYWRIRTRHAATGETIRSQWSEVKSFTIRVGLRVIAPSLGPQPLSPANGVDNVPVSPSFTWTSLPGTTEYELILGRDANLKDIVVVKYVPISAYHYAEKLKYNTTYFWQARATKPAPSDPSPVSYFTTVKENTLPPPPPPPPSLPPSTGLSSVYIGVTIGIVFVLCLLILILIAKIKGRICD